MGITFEEALKEALKRVLDEEVAEFLALEIDDEDEEFNTPNIVDFFRL